MTETETDLTTVRLRLMESTQSLLGNTIAIDDAQWLCLSRLPGWTRAHVAAHLARNADALAGVMQELRQNGPTSLYESDDAHFDQIERGSERTAMELQVDLDASAGRLDASFNGLPGLPPDRLVCLSPTMTVRLDRLPVARLNEVVLHHIDLDVGFTCADVSDEVAHWLLAYNAERVGRSSGYPAIRLASDSGVNAVIGGPGHPIIAHGQDNQLLGWLTGRLDPDQVDKRLPPLPCR